MNFQSHITKAISFEKNANVKDMLEWQSVKLFYAGLHYVHAFLSLSNIHPPDHRAILNEIISNNLLIKLHADYKLLYDDSLLSRYHETSLIRNTLSDYKHSLSKIKSILHTDGEYLRNII